MQGVHSGPPDQSHCEEIGEASQVKIWLERRMVFLCVGGGWSSKHILSQDKERGFCCFTLKWWSSFASAADPNRPVERPIVKTLPFFLVCSFSIILSGAGKPQIPLLSLSSFSVCVTEGVCAGRGVPRFCPTLNSPTVKGVHVSSQSTASVCRTTLIASYAF